MNRKKAFILTWLLLLALAVQSQGIENATFVRRSFVRNYYNLSQPYAGINMKGTDLFEENANSLVTTHLKGTARIWQTYGALHLQADDDAETIVRCSDFNPFLCYEVDIDSMDGGEAGATFYNSDHTRRMVVSKSDGHVNARFFSEQGCIDSVSISENHRPPLTLRVQMTGRRLHVFTKGQGHDTLLLSREIPRRLYAAANEDNWCIDSCFNWNFGLYARQKAGEACVVSRVEAFFSSGTGQADPSIVQDKHGRPYIRDNRLYVALTTRGFGLIPDSHQGIYSIDVSTMEWRKEGVLLFQRDGDRLMHPYHATKIVRDDDNQEWRIMTVSHGEDHQLVWAVSRSDILKGFHILDTHALNEPHWDTHTDEDPDFIWDEQRQSWVLAFVSIMDKAKGYQTVLCESRQWNGGYREIAVSEVGNETGTRLLRTDDGLRVLSGGDTYNVLDYPTLKRIGGLHTVYPDGGFRGWPSIAPVPSDNGYSYLWITFDRGRSKGKYSYGTLYHFVGK